MAHGSFAIFLYSIVPVIKRKLKPWLEVEKRINL